MENILAESTNAEHTPNLRPRNPTYIYISLIIILYIYKIAKMKASISSRIDKL